MDDLRIARGFALPLDVVGEATAILAKRGAGKTNTAVVMVEETHRNGVQFCVLDPVGVWYGLRAGTDGDAVGGIDCVVLGGPHGDLPLEAHAGSFIADVVVDSAQSFVLDLSDFSKSQQRRFVADFAQRLYERKGRSRSPLLVVMEEADEFAPQRVQANEAPMVGAISLIVKRGRSRGLGILVITQRSASLNKDVLDQADVLVVMRTVGPRDVAAIKGWIEHQEADGFDQVLPSLASLETGEAWVWNPERGVLQRTKIRARKTFDSSGTPRPGERRAEPRQVRPVDLEALGTQMAEMAERMKQNDPVELRKEISRLRRELQKREDEATETIVEKIVEVPVLSAEDLERLDRLVTIVQEKQAASVAAFESLRDVLSPIAANVRDALKLPRSPAREPSDTRRPPSKVAPARPALTDSDRGASGGGSREDDNGEVRLNRKAERRVLEVLAQYPEGRSKRQLAILSGYAVKGGGFNAALSKLRTVGYIRGSDVISITDEGVEAITWAWEPLPTGEALLDHWLRTFNRKAEREVLRVIYEAYPESLPKIEVAERSGYEVAGGGFNAALSKLRTLELIEGSSEIKAADAFFEEVYA